jgi:diguanylate cyclase (GGDEF)-like protein
MRKRSWSVIARASFLHQLALTFAVGIICLGLLSSLAISTLSSQTVHAKLIEHGLQATETLAGQSTLALLYLSADNAEEPLRATLAFPDVLGAGIYDLAHKPVLTRGKNTLPSSGHIAWPARPLLDLETDEAWYFVAPVYVRHGHENQESPFVTDRQEAELIGHVRVKMGKSTLKTMAASILHTNLLVSIAFALVLLLLLLAITKRLTIPLKNLAEIMRKASSGEKNLRADVRGPKDIIDMEKAFNTMMTVLETREQQLENARDAALESARLKGEFAANVSHELRTPLNAVLGMLELLNDMGLTPKQLEYATVARNAGESLLKLIDDILDFSRADSGKIKLQPVDFNLAEILDETVGLLASQAQRKGLDLGYVIAPEVPPTLRGDPVRIRQVLVNLVGNALKFTERGAVEIKVRPDEKSHDKIPLRFEVVDTGIGIPQEAQQRIFEAFTQVDGSSTRNYGGAGLGLAICRQLVAFMGGQIGIESTPDQGSTFWFTVPLEKPPHLAGQSWPHRTEMTGLRLLIVDESEVNRRFLEQLLSGWGAIPRSAADAQQAFGMLRLAAARGEPFHFAVVDQTVPGIGAVEFARRLAADLILAQVRVIAMTNQPRPGPDQGTTANIVGWISKPVRGSFLYDCLVNARTLPAHHDPALPEEAPDDGLAVQAPKRILVVEDNRASQQVAIGMLERLGCTVELAGTGQEALDLLQAGAYDLILMDCHMPQMDGYEATRRIRGLGDAQARTPIIAMTANVQSGDSELCLAAGMDDYLPKPLKLDLLREKLRHWLAREKPAPYARGEPGGEPWIAEPKGGYEGLDGQVLNKLREDTGDVFARMIEVFLEDTPLYLQSLENAICNQDFQSLAELAHCIKGSGRNLGATRLVAIAKQLEDLGRSHSCVGAAELFAKLAAAFDRVRIELERELQPETAPVREDEPDAPRIIVADDDRAMRFALQNVLQKDGYRIEQAANGLQALALCERQMPDLVLMDAIMPKMDGFTACTRIRELPNGLGIPILIITALDDDHSIEWAFSAGATDYIPKPVHFAVLRRRVARMLESSRAQKHITRLAYQDVLTGLPNRTYFREQLEKTLNRSAEDGQNPVHALLFLDLDRFKLANDTMGHEVGDLLLRTAAERIKAGLRPGDLASRFGGDEFILFLENIGSPEAAATLAEKICGSISRPFVFAGREFFISGSIGIALYPSDGTDGTVLIKHADMAMFRAKERGNTYRFFEDTMENTVSKKLRMESDLRRALERDEFRLHYQPQVDTHTGRIVCMEALILWDHPELGLVSPTQFIPLAEETGLIENIGEWVLRTACTQNKDWQDAGLPKIPVAINLSAKQLEMDYESRVVLEALEESGLDPAYLELELTESAVMKDPQKTRDSLRRLKEAGILISIDDFGTGYSSLNHLKHFSFDKLKIDQSFIRDVTTNPDDAAIVLTIIAIAKTLKLKVIAEGVETEEQYRYLQRHDCDEIQGYYFSRPVPPETAAQLLSRRTIRVPATLVEG